MMNFFFSSKQDKDDNEEDLKVSNLYNMSNMKYVIDKRVEQFVGETLEYGLEAGPITNMILGFIAVALAIIAHFYPIPYPRNYYLLVTSVIVYVLFTYVIPTFVIIDESDKYVLISEPKTVGKGPGAREIVLKIESNLPSFDEHYSVRVSAFEKGKDKQKENVQVNETISVGLLFDKNGLLIVDCLDTMIFQMVKKIEAEVLLTA